MFIGEFLAKTILSCLPDLGGGVLRFFGLNVIRLAVRLFTLFRSITAVSIKVYSGAKILANVRLGSWKRAKTLHSRKKE